MSFPPAPTVLSDADAQQTFEAEIGPGLFVPPNGARIYWPGFGTGVDEPRHRYWTQATLRERPLDAELRKMLSRLSVGRVPDDPVPARIQSLLARSAVDRLRSQGEEGAREAALSSEQQLADLQNRYDALEKEAFETLERNEQLQSSLEGERQARATLAERVTTAEENLRTAYEWRADRDEEGEGGEGGDDEATVNDPPDSWLEMGERIIDLVGPGFQLTDRALECAQGNAYPSPARMWVHLERLSKAGEAYNAASASVGTRFAEWVVGFSLDVALTDSSYGETEFTYDGVALDRLPHVKIDDAVAPSEVGRIYFAIDSVNARLVVDWFGVKRDRP